MSASRRRKPTRTYEMDNKREFCYCGRLLKVWAFGNSLIKRCPKHGLDIEAKEEKVRKLRFSGATRRMKGKYEDY